jgi:hypothetical protein
VSKKAERAAELWEEECKEDKERKHRSEFREEELRRKAAKVDRCRQLRREISTLHAERDLWQQIVDEENTRLRASLAAKEEQNENGRMMCDDLLNRLAAKDALLGEAMEAMRSIADELGAAGDGMSVVAARTVAEDFIARLREGEGGGK